MHMHTVTWSAEFLTPTCKTWILSLFVWVLKREISLKLNARHSSSKDVFCSPFIISFCVSLKFIRHCLWFWGEGCVPVVLCYLCVCVWLPCLRKSTATGFLLENVLLIKQAWPTRGMCAALPHYLSKDHKSKWKMAKDASVAHQLNRKLRWTIPAWSACHER